MACPGGWGRDEISFSRVGLLRGSAGVWVVVVGADVGAVVGVFEGDGAAEANGGADYEGDFVEEELGGKGGWGGSAGGGCGCDCGGRGTVVWRILRTWWDGCMVGSGKWASQVSKSRAEWAE